MTTSSPSRTRVRFIRGGVAISETELPGTLLEFELPTSVSASRTRGSVDLIESGDPTLECCGELTLPWASPTDHGVERLRIDAPAPFVNSDLRTMWEARNRLVLRHRPPTGGDADWASLALVDYDGLAWEQLGRARDVAQVLLARWPTHPIAETEWRPLDRPGGRLLVAETERTLKNHAVDLGDRVSPAKTARRYSRPEDRRLLGLALLATLAAERLSSETALDEHPALKSSLIDLFRRVAWRSYPAWPVRDPPPSTWPSGMAAAHVALLRLLTTLRDKGVGESSAPLSELWELYQSWLAESLAQALDHALGPRITSHSSGSRIGVWPDGAGEVELRYEPQFSTALGGRGTDVLGRRLVGVIGTLRPDLVMARREGGEWRAVVVDAKKRSAPLEVDDLSIEASKYLWGVRFEGSKAVVPVLSAVFLGSPVGGQAAAHSEGRAMTIEAHPAVGWRSSDVELLLDVVRGATSAP